MADHRTRPEPALPTAPSPTASREPTAEPSHWWQIRWWTAVATLAAAIR